MRIGLLVIVLLMLIGVACNRGDDETSAPQSEITPVPPTATPVTRIQVPIPTPPPVGREASPEARLVVEDVEGSVGDVIPVKISVQDVETGVAGFAIQVSFADPDIARVTDVTLPEFGLSMIGDLPAASVDITAVDLPELIQGAFAEETIVTIEVELRKAGRTEIMLQLRILDDDNGDAIRPEVVNGSLIVN